jgi:hypothetical protein
VLWGSGDVHLAGISVRGRVRASGAYAPANLEDRIVQWPKRGAVGEEKPGYQPLNRPWFTICS